MDATSHRYTLLRDLRVRMQRAMAPLLDAAAAANEGPEHEEVVYQRCLQHQTSSICRWRWGGSSRRLRGLDVAHADGIASAVTDGRAASEERLHLRRRDARRARRAGDLPPFPSSHHPSSSRPPRRAAHGDAAPEARGSARGVGCSASRPPTSSTPRRGTTSPSRSPRSCARRTPPPPPWSRRACRRARLRRRSAR